MDNNNKTQLSLSLSRSLNYVLFIHNSHFCLLDCNFFSPFEFSKKKLLIIRINTNETWQYFSLSLSFREIFVQIKRRNLEKNRPKKHIVSFHLICALTDFTWNICDSKGPLTRLYKFAHFKLVVIVKIASFFIRIFCLLSFRRLSKKKIRKNKIKSTKNKSKFK